jgi:hypothetical protein
MSALKNLKIVVAPAKTLQTPEQARRDKLAMKLIEQMQMAEAELKGTVFQRMKRVWITDENGDRKKIERPARLKKWWSKDHGGIIFLRVFYGARPIELAKGKTAVEIEKMEKLPSTLETLMHCALNGELDDAIRIIAKERVPKMKPKGI